MVIAPQNRDHHLQNVEIIVADISTFDMEASYDRIFSIGMFEVSYFSLTYIELLDLVWYC